MSKWPAPFQYAQDIHSRRHGPRGYSDAKRYKPWLRDDFVFRCVYCLIREKWCPDGEDAFSVEHHQPPAVDPHAVFSYENLLYMSCRCNAAKRDLTGVLNPAEVPLADHLEVLDDGRIRGLTEDGVDLIQICQLDRPNLVAFRRSIFELLDLLSQSSSSGAQSVLRRYFGFPSNLPRLSTLRPPNGNSRLDGIAESYYWRRMQGELPEYY